MSEHRQEFDNELEAIESKVIELFAMVAEGLPAATQALLNSDNEAVRDCWSSATAPSTPSTSRSRAWPTGR